MLDDELIAMIRPDGARPAFRNAAGKSARARRRPAPGRPAKAMSAWALLLATALAAGGASAAGGILGAPAAVVPQCPADGPVVVQPCAVDETLILFDQPVYDDDGLFLVCTETVPYCVPAGLEPEGDTPAGGGVTMLKMLGDQQRDGQRLPRALEELAVEARTRDPLADTTITCNDDTHICTCVSDASGDCEAKLAAICDSAESFGANGGVGKDCPTVDD